MKLSSLFFVLMSIPAMTTAGIDDSINIKYDKSYQVIHEVLKSNGSFKKAVYVTESTFRQLITEEEYYGLIRGLTTLAGINKTWYKAVKYHDSDSANFLINRSIFAALCDSVKINEGLSQIAFQPFAYNFQDPNGKMDWTNTFVSKALTNRKGNCRSLTYLYKILADELGAHCWLALAPGHTYIRNYSQKIGWYNTELTSGTFPTDAWIAASGYISTDAIRSGIYMDTLSNQQSIALCVLDLAKGYEFQSGNYYDGFILKCCDLVLQYHPVNPMALLLKAETLKKVYFKQTEEKQPDADSTYAEMGKTYLTLAKLHYREMPEKMYREWLLSASKQKDKYSNKKIPDTYKKK